MMIGNVVAGRRSDERALDAERKLLQQALTRLDQVQKASALKRPTARLIFGLDLTGSREACIAQSRIATAAMFEALRAIGKIALKLVYFRGMDECRASPWHDHPDTLCSSMLGLSCESGYTQIARILNLALTENNLSGVVFVGDHFEDDRNEVETIARKLGDAKTPVFVFHECTDHDKRALRAKPAFKRIAQLSGGMYVEFKAGSGDALKEMLSNVAAISAGGVEGLGQLALPKTKEGRELRNRLQLGSGDRSH